MNKDQIINILNEYWEYYKLNQDGRYYGYLRAINQLRNLDMNQIYLVSTKEIYVYGIGPAITSKIYQLLHDELPTSLIEIRQSMNPSNPHKHPTDRNIVEDYARKLFPNYNYLLMGSYRRGNTYCGDGDIMMIDEDPSEVRELIHSNESLEMVSEGDSKLKFICHDLGNFEYDVRFTTDESKGCMILMMTGSANFNIRMRSRAKSLGYSINEYGVTDPNGDFHQFKDEIDVFNFLGFEYVDPTNR